MFSYVVLDDMQDSLSGLEVLALIWFIALLVEELRQMDFGWRWREYWADAWNRCESASKAVCDGSDGTG